MHLLKGESSVQVDSTPLKQILLAAAHRGFWCILATASKYWYIVSVNMHTPFFSYEAIPVLEVYSGPSNLWVVPVLGYSRPRGSVRD